jgi:uncharacterized protein YuzB (UPF0349 family)
MSAGRKKDPVWVYFDEEKTSTDKGVRIKAKCKSCGKQLQGLVARLKDHKGKCISGHIEDSDSEAPEPEMKQQPSSSQSLPVAPTKSLKRLSDDGSSSSSKISKTTLNMDSYVIKTSKQEKGLIDEQIARGMYATNASFRTIEHPEVIKAYKMLRPGYTPPSRKEIAGSILDSVHQKEIENCALILEGQFVCMCIDGWSNVHNEPIICACVTTQSGDVYLLETIDTSGNPHTGDYLADITLATIKKTENNFKCKVRSFVTDNASNMTKMREELEKDESGVDVLTYGCSAHILNLLAKDLQIVGVKEHVVEIIKFFRNHHLPRAYLAAEGKGPGLVLPQDVRWNTLCDCLESFIKNWPVLLKICEDHRDVIDTGIRNKVTNLAIKRNAEDLLKILKPIAVALDKIQKNSCTISDALVIWKDLEKNLLNLLDVKGKREFSKRYKMALTPAHFLASLLDPRVAVGTLSAKESEAGLEFAQEKYAGTSLLSLIIKFQARAEPFNGAMFAKEAVASVTAVEWWQSFKAMKKDACTTREMECIVQLMTAVASSAGVERVFSTFNLVHSNVRNRLGIEKAAKLVFIMKLLNK